MHIRTRDSIYNNRHFQRRSPRIVQKSGRYMLLLHRNRIIMGKINRENKRNIIQVAFAVLINGFVKGFSNGKIFKGATKNVCVPVLNCYSCPGALGACPIGSLQSILSGRKYKFSFYVLGTLMLFGIVLGRAVCGFLCPFGLIQGLLYKIPKLKINVPKKADKILRWLKYVVLIMLVILLPVLVRDDFGFGTTYFCKLICPAGTLEAGIPLLIANRRLRKSIGALFNWKITVAAVILIFSILIYRPFCKYFCPLGAIYSLFNKFSMYRLKLDDSKCVGCKACEKACPMQVEVTRNINSLECIRCGKCISACKEDAISGNWK